MHHVTLVSALWILQCVWVLRGNVVVLHLISPLQDVYTSVSGTGDPQTTCTCGRAVHQRLLAIKTEVLASKKRTLQHSQSQVQWNLANPNP